MATVDRVLIGVLAFTVLVFGLTSAAAFAFGVLVGRAFLWWSSRRA